MAAFSSGDLLRGLSESCEDAPPSWLEERCEEKRSLRNWGVSKADTRSETEKGYTDNEELFHLQDRTKDEVLLMQTMA